MATGSSGDSEFKNTLYYEIKTPKGEDPFLRVMKPDRDETGKRIYKELETKTWVSGNIWDIKIREKAYEGRPYKVVSISLVDGDTIYHVEIGLSYLGRSMISRLLSLEQFAGILRIGVYTSEPGDGFERGFASPSLKMDDEVVKFKHKPSVINDLITEVEGDDGKIKQFKKANEFVLNELETTILLKWAEVKASVRLLSRGSDTFEDKANVPDQITEEKDITPDDKTVDEKDELPF